MRGAIFLLALVVGLASFAVASVLVAERVAFLRGASRAHAVVVENRGSSSVCPVFRFAPVGAEPVDIATTVCTKGAQFQPGQAVDVLYDARDPRGSARIDTFTQIWGAPLIFGFWAIVWTLVGVLGRRRAKPNPNAS